MLNSLLVLLLCRLLRRHTPPDSVSEPKEIGLNRWWVEEAGTCRRCGTWRRRRRRVPAPPCDHVFPHVCAECREQAEAVWSGAPSVESVRGGRAAAEPSEDELIDRESGVPR